MTEDADPFAPPWTLHVTLGSAALALVSLLVGDGESASILAAVSLTGITYLLYKWGQYRERPSKYSDDPDRRRREMQMEAEAGGYGGNK